MKKRSRMPTLAAFGARLRALRGRHSREAISIRLGELGVPLGGSTLAQYEKGLVWAPDAGVLWGLARIYGQDLAELIALLRANRNDPAMSTIAHNGVLQSSGNSGPVLEPHAHGDDPDADISHAKTAAQLFDTLVETATALDELSQRIHSHIGRQDPPPRNTPPGESHHSREPRGLNAATARSGSRSRAS
jgi:transcriptional regulator with XRE-family HTH domain